MNKKHIAKPLLSNPIEPYPGLTVSDLNRYLPALQKVNDIDYYIGLNRYITDGISAMNDNDESDSYNNKGLHGSLDFKLSENLKIDFTDISYIEYDSLFENGSAEITSWNWVFDDNGTSLDINPSNTYQTINGEISFYSPSLSNINYYRFRLILHV